jgi:hypothetical protein
MKICYVILTCQKYLKTRGEWQRNTWIKDVEQDPDSTYYFLSAIEDPVDKHIVGYYTKDDYASCPIKYKKFIINNGLYDYDYVFFCDDDTYVYHSRLKELLQKYDPKEKYYIGSWLSHEKQVKAMSGGAGFALSLPLYTALREYMTKTRVSHSFHSDMSMGEWIRDLKCEFNFIDENGNLNQNTHEKHGYQDVLPSHVSFHYVTEELFRYYYSKK